MIRAFILAAALAAGLSSAAQAQVADVVSSCGSGSGISTPLGPGGHLVRDANGNLCTSSPANSTAAGTSATSAQAVQGVTGGVPVGIVGAPAPSASFSVTRTGSIGTTAVQVAAADPVNRRAVANTGMIACEVMPSATAFGTGYPLPVGGSFAFAAIGQTTAALFVACSTTGGSVAVMSY